MLDNLAFVLEGILVFVNALQFISTPTREILKNGRCDQGSQRHHSHPGVLSSLLVASVDLASSYLSKGGTFGGPDDDHYFVDLLHPGMQVHSERPEPSGRVRPSLDVQLLGDPQVRLQLDRLCASKRSSDHDDDQDSMKQEG